MSLWIREEIQEVLLEMNIINWLKCILAMESKGDTIPAQFIAAVILIILIIANMALAAFKDNMKTGKF